MSRNNRPPMPPSSQQAAGHQGSVATAPGGGNAPFLTLTQCDQLLFVPNAVQEQYEDSIAKTFEGVVLYLEQRTGYNFIPPGMTINKSLKGQYQANREPLGSAVSTILVLHDMLVRCNAGMGMAMGMGMLNALHVDTVL